MSRPAVLVLGVYHQTLAVMRSLHRAGYAVILGRGPGRCPELFSTACAGSWVHPPVDDPAFGQALQDYLRDRPEIRHVFPIGEDDALALGDLAPVLRPELAIAMVRPALVRACRDKSAASAVAAGAGLAVPATAIVASVDQLERAAGAIGFPLIVKPVMSKQPLLGRKAILLVSPEDLGSEFARWPEPHRKLVVQAYVAGPLEACDFVAQGGRLVGYFEAASVRTDMSDGTGYAVDFLSRPISPDVIAACRQFCAATEYEGPGLLQFIRSTGDGRLYFVENNPRLSAGIAQAVLCGQDLPLLALQVATRRLSDDLLPDFDERDAYTPNMRTHWLYRDLQGIINRRRALERAELLGRLRQLAASAMAADTHMVWQWRDPAPSVVLYLRLLGRALQGALRRRR